MLIRWRESDNAFSVMDEMRRQMDRYLNELADGPRTTEWARGWPRMEMIDSKSELLVRAELPGLSEQDVDVSVNQDVVTISGERKADVPEGYKVHRHERASVKFFWSFALPCRVDLEKASATARNGILTVTLPKAPESQPRQITVKAT